VRLGILLISFAACGLVAQTPPGAAQQAPQEQIFPIGNGVSAPRVLQQVAPEHPSRGFKISGVVLIGLVVSSSGQPQDVHVVKSLEHDVDQAAIEAVRKWSFEPARKEGQPVAVRITVEIRFHDM